MAIDYSWEHSTPSGTQIHYNKIVGNSEGVVSGIWGSDRGDIYPEQVDAITNWWGYPSGPYYLSNLDGEGDTVSDNVDYRPWCTEDTCTDVDSDNPTIISYTPADNTVGVDPAGNITVTFNEEVTITTSDVELKKSGTDDLVEITVTFDSDNYKATIIPSSTLDNNSTYAIKIETSVDDLAGNQLAQEKSWSFTTSGSYNIQLTKGWNLISMPVVPNDTTIESILGSAATSIEVVWAYDAVNGTWYVYRPTSPSTSNLASMTAGGGYWINYTSVSPATLAGPGNLFLEGNNVPPQRTLKAGWNLIGYYQKQNTDSVQATHALNSLINPDTNNPWWTTIMGYNNDSKKFTEISNQNNFDPGKGYWILMAGRATDTYIYAPGITQ